MHKIVRCLFGLRTTWWDLDLTGRLAHKWMLIWCFYCISLIIFCWPVVEMRGFLGTLVDKSTRCGWWPFSNGVEECAGLVWSCERPCSPCSIFYFVWGQHWHQVVSCFYFHSSSLLKFGMPVGLSSKNGTSSMRQNEVRFLNKKKLNK